MRNVIRDLHALITVLSRLEVYEWARVSNIINKYLLQSAKGHKERRSRLEAAIEQRQAKMRELELELGLEPRQLQLREREGGDEGANH